jgi:hypothetical protein
LVKKRELARFGAATIVCRDLGILETNQRP